ncbi:unnamed protein product [Effrenium voratum]|nr:unnamed protein product [Effrenium voratum]
MFRMLLVALLATGGLAQSQDTVVLQQANATVDKYCSVALSELDVEGARQDLETGAGEDNVIYQAIVNAGLAVQEGQTPEELTEVLQQVADPGFVAGKAFAIVLSIVLFVMWVLCCWFVCCPCFCRVCCCCCQKPTDLGKSRICQAILWLIFISIGIAAVILVSLSLRGYTNIDEGIQGTACSAAQLVKDGVGGSTELNFIGLLPAINELERLANTLNAGSSFMTTLDNIVASTSEIDRAVALVSGTLQRMQDYVSDPVNQEPTGYMHECTVCAPLATSLVPVLSAFNGGVGNALSSTRAEVAQQLQGPGLADMRSSIQEAMSPIREAKTQILDTVGFFVKPDGFQKETEIVNGDNSALQPSILALFAIYLLIFFAGFCALGGFCAKHKGKSEKDHCCVRFSMGCSMCSACIYAMVVLMIGGIMVIVAMVGSGTCLVLLDFNQEMGESLMAALGQEVDPTLQMALTIADRCLSLESTTTSANATRNLADIIKIPSTSNASQMTTVRETLIDLAIVPINEQFDALQVALNSEPPALATNTELTALRSMVAALDMKALYWPKSSAVAADSTYSAMLQAYELVSLSCGNTTLSTALPSPLGGVQVAGMDAMVRDGFTLEGNAVPPVGDFTSAMVWTCPTTLTATCDVSLTTQEQDACNAAKNFVVDKKLALVNSPSAFKCKYMQKPGFPANTPCKPGDMTQDGSGNWQNVCADSNNQVTFFEQTCSLAEYQMNLQDMDADMLKAFQYLDSTVARVLTAVSVNLEQAVRVEVISPLLNLLSSFDCTFMRNFWEGLTSAMCYRSMNGFRMIANSYVWVAILSLIIGLLLYVPWKFSRDNYDGLLREEAPAMQESL